MRLRNFVEQSARATRIGGIFDDAATAQGLLNYFRLAMHSGAIIGDEIPGLTGLSVDELTVGSFTEIFARRQGN